MLFDLFQRTKNEPKSVLLFWHFVIVILLLSLHWHNTRLNFTKMVIIYINVLIYYHIYIYTFVIRKQHNKASHFYYKKILLPSKIIPLTIWKNTQKKSINYQTTYSTIQQDSTAVLKGRSKIMIIYYIYCRLSTVVVSSKLYWDNKSFKSRNILYFLYIYVAQKQ